MTPVVLADRAGLPVAVNRRRRSLARLAAYLGASLAAVALAVAVLLLVLGDTLLNAYGKGRAERAFATAYPGWVLQLGVLSYEVSANRLVAQSVALSGTQATLKTGPVSLTGVRRSRLLWGTLPLVEALGGPVSTRRISLWSFPGPTTESAARGCGHRCRGPN